MNKLVSLINSLPSEEVQKIQQDLLEGNLAAVLQERLAELEVPQKVCPVCNTPLTDDAPYVLYFGTDIRKKARFDALDCLEFFITNDLKEPEAPKPRETHDKSRSNRRGPPSLL